MRIEKVKLTALGGLLAHDLRFDGDGIDHAKEGRGQGEKIDQARTCLNRLVEKRPDGEGWALREPTLSDRRAAIRRLRDAERSHKETRGRRVGKNTVTASLVATKPKDWPGTDDEFVEVTASYLDGMPGETLAMVVHYDETTPHIHCVKLLTSDAGTIQGFSAVYDRRVYQRFHTDMVEFSRAQGFDAGWLLDEDDEVGKALSGLDQRRYGIIKEKLSEVESREAAVALVEQALSERQDQLDRRERALSEVEQAQRKRAADLDRQQSQLDRMRSDLDRRAAQLAEDRATFDQFMTTTYADLDKREKMLNRREQSLKEGLRNLDIARDTSLTSPNPANDGKTMSDMWPS